MSMLEPDIHDHSNVRMVGMISSLFLALVTLLTFVMAVLTPPMSGPFAGAARIVYPYGEAITRFPRDYYWMYPAMAMALIFIIYTVSIDAWTRPGRKIFSRIALVFAILGAGTIFLDYFLQLAVVQPSLLNGEMDGIALLSQYNPHGIFIALEEAGYLLIALSVLFLAPVFAGHGKIGAVLSWTAVVSFIATIAALVIISLIFGTGREYRFEVAVISFDFIALIIIGAASLRLIKSGKM